MARRQHGRKVEQKRARARASRFSCIDWAWWVERARVIGARLDEDGNATSPEGCRPPREHMFSICALTFTREKFDRGALGKAVREVWALLYPEPCEPAPAPPQCAA